MIKLPPTVVNYRWLQQQLTAAGFVALQCSCDFMRFDRNIKINRNLFGILRNFTDSISIFIEFSAKKKKLKIQFLGRRFDVLVS